VVETVGFESRSAPSQSTAACLVLFADGLTHHLASRIARFSYSFSTSSLLTILRLRKAVQQRNLVGTFASRCRSLKHLLASFVIGP
jgi:hypothetical protein